MTYNECYNFAVSEFTNAKNTDARFDASVLMQFVFDLDRGELLMCGDTDASDGDVLTFKGFVKDRVSGIPLQYIIGEWDFFDYTFCVGKGVLIPRPETEILVSEALKHLSVICNDDVNCKPVVYDLCSGSGCVGISIAKSFPAANVFAFEKSPEALRYLLKNTARNAADNVTVLESDILTGDYSGFINVSVPESADVIVSNPPYIRTAELAGLQKEVLSEPMMALDGGEDGLMFYRAIADIWLPRLKNGGLLLAECGEDQAEDIEQIFSICGIKTFKICDFAGIYRVVGAKKR